ncbi:MAG TPA: Ig-like domain-containing protein [Pyrinomonadaceae bacterium]|nr:Ig-like domain-containing protein [Pyrinomonadaceae bacterium]
MRQRLVSLLLLTLLAAAPARGQSGPQLTQSAVAGGGGASAQGAFRVEGTIGQGVAGASSGGVFSLDGGFVLALANGAPVNAAPATHATDEDTPLAFNGANSVSVSDADAGASHVRVTLTAVNGTLTLGDTTGLIFMAGAGGDAQLIFTGALADANTALAGLTFNPAPDFNGSASLTVETDDLGHTGEGGARQDTDAVNITVNPVNDPPSAAGQSLATDEETPVGVTLSGSDPETAAAGLAFAVTAQPAHGSLSGAAPNLTYTPADGYAGPDSFKFTVTDAGDGAAPALTSAEATVSVNVASVPDIFARDARAAEPKSGETPMLFTVTLERAPASTVTVDFATASGPAGAGAATEGGDYTARAGTLTFAPGQRVQTVSVPVLHDSQTEPDETFRLTLSNASGGRIVRGAATGEITTSSAAGAVLISELRTFGPGAGNLNGDQFVEVYNNSDSPVTVSTADGSPGWGLFKAGADCDATPVLVGTIPNDTVIPARGHFLFAGPDYSLADYGGAGAAEGDAGLEQAVEPNRGVGLFRTTDAGNLSSVTRLDAVGFGAGASNNCALLREGNGLGELAANVSALGQHSFFRKLCDFVGGKGCQTNGTPKDTQDNASDFAFADTNGTQVVGVGHLLGAPGPENLDSPRQTNLITAALLDGSLGGAVPPNRVRDHSDVIPGVADAGTMSIRRRVINNTGAPVSRLRFRISEMTTYPATAGAADMRALDSVSVSGVNITNDSGTCGGPASCAVTVGGTTLEQEPNQPAGGGLNATLTVTLGTPLAAGDHVLVHFRLGVKQTGLFRFYIVTETLP